MPFINMNITNSISFPLPLSSFFFSQPKQIRPNNIHHHTTAGERRPLSSFSIHPSPQTLIVVTCKRPPQKFWSGSATVRMSSTCYKIPRLMMNIHCFGRNLATASCCLPPVQLPANKEAHFWYVLPHEVKCTNLLNRYFEILSPCEKENVLRMRGEELKKSALLARALVRTTLARYQTNCQIDPKSLKFRKNDYGKPEVDWQYADDQSLPPLHFNISHTSSLIACGVTVGSPIGIDVEEKQRRLKNDILAFARRYFSPHEVEMLAHIVDPELRRQEFIKLWTLKEAYVKALGRGFSASPFNTFTIRLRDHVKGGIYVPPHVISKEAEITVEPSGDLKNPSSNWHFVLLELIGSHYAAVCIEEDSTNADKGSIPVNLIIRKTIPFVEDECISGTDSAEVIGGLSKLLVC